MKCHIKVELINPVDNTIHESQEADGVITDVRKHLSTFGYPQTMRDSGITISSSYSNVFAQGCVAFSNKLGSSKSDCFFGLDDDLVAFGSRYTSESYSHSTKFGTYNREYEKADYKSFSKTWEWSEEHGNGKISSVALTHAAGAHFFDKGEQFTVSGSIPGNDYTTLLGAITGNSINIDGNQAFSSNQQYALMYCAQGEYYRGPSVYYYQTDKNIVQLVIKSLNVETTTESGKKEYVTTLLYRVIDKKWCYKYKLFSSKTNDAVYLGYTTHNPLSLPYLEDSSSPKLSDGFDGELQINSGSAILRLTAKNNMQVQDYAYVILFSVNNDTSPSENPDRKDERLTDRVVSFVITGDTPTVYKFDSVYKSPLNSIAQNSEGRSYISTFVIFDKEFNYIYTRYRGNRPAWRYIAKRSLQSDAFIWKISIANDGTNGSGPSYLFSPDNNVFVMRNKGGGDSSLRTYTNYLRRISDGEIVGYSYGYDVPSRTILNSADSTSPFVLIPDMSTERDSYFWRPLIKTNYLYCKADLPKSIEKTSSYKMRITVTCEFEDGD